MMKPNAETVLKKISEIESELQRLKYWKSEPLPKEKFENMGAFGMNTMAPEEWIQFVLVPRVRTMASTDEGWPDSSSVGAWAVRNFDGNDEARGLVTLLCEFDRLFRQ